MCYFGVDRRVQDVAGRPTPRPVVQVPFAALSRRPPLSLAPSHYAPHPRAGHLLRWRPRRLVTPRCDTAPPLRPSLRPQHASPRSPVASPPQPRFRNLLIQIHSCKKPPNRTQEAPTQISSKLIVNTLSYLTHKKFLTPSLKRPYKTTLKHTAHPKTI